MQLISIITTVHLRDEWHKQTRLLEVAHREQGGKKRWLSHYYPPTCHTPTHTLGYSLGSTVSWAWGAPARVAGSTCVSEIALLRREHQKRYATDLAWRALLTQVP